MDIDSVNAASAAAEQRASSGSSGLEHLNAILIARGYIKKPLNFKIASSDNEARAKSDSEDGGDRLDTIADLLTTILAERDLDLSIKADLSAKVRAMESGLTRKDMYLEEEIGERLKEQTKKNSAAMKAT
jgi:hypothetical protein